MAYPTSAYYSDAAWDGAATLVRAGRVMIGTVVCHNENAATRYLQLFNAAAVANVTLGTTEPTVNIPITTDAMQEIELNGTTFDLGLVIALTTATRGATTGGTGNIVIEIK